MTVFANYNPMKTVKKINKNKITKFQYASNWDMTCKRTHKLQPKCTNNSSHGYASIVHHLKYKISLIRRAWYALRLVFHCFIGIAALFINRKTAIKHFDKVLLLAKCVAFGWLSGVEIPGWDCVTVCHQCHENSYGRSNNRDSVHYYKHWIQKGGIENHQVARKAWELRLRFWLLVIIR